MISFHPPTESPLEIVLLQALPEKERMELIIQKATELGVSMIVPFQIGKIDLSQERERPSRRRPTGGNTLPSRPLQQSRRARVPLVEEVLFVQEALEFLRRRGFEDHPLGKRGRETQRCPETVPCKSSLFNPLEPKGGRGGFEASPPTRIYAMVGPEGGFTEEEVRQAKETGFIPVKLGQRILRTETAAITLVGILQYELGDLG